LTTLALDSGQSASADRGESTRYAKPGDKPEDDGQIAAQRLHLSNGLCLGRDG
nr:hypothetical protein [Tanacetum cinerariifolium]